MLQYINSASRGYENIKNVLYRNSHDLFSLIIIAI